MTIIAELERQYFEIENDYAAKEFQARSRGHAARENYWRRKRELNTHAYFLFAFTQLENHIRGRSIALIQNKRAAIGHWKTKAIWENTNHDNMHLMKRVGLLTEKGQTAYNRIKGYYDTRNSIAHGNLIPGITIAINMIDVFSDIKVFFRNLRG